MPQVFRGYLDGGFTNLLLSAAASVHLQSTDAVAYPGPGGIMNRRIAALSLSAVLALGLAGCTVSPTPGSPSPSRSAPAASSSAGSQSVAEACALVQQTIDQATDEFSKATTADPAEVLA